MELEPSGLEFLELDESPKNSSPDTFSGPPSLGGSRIFSFRGCCWELSAEAVNDLELGDVGRAGSGQNGDRRVRRSAILEIEGEMLGEGLCRSWCIRLYGAVLPYGDEAEEKHRVALATLAPEVGRQYSCLLML